MSGHVGDLSPKQEQALQQFREVCADILKKDDDDYYCLRWLRARNFDVQQSKDMLKKSLAWRKSNNIDTILTDYEPPAFLKKNLVGGTYGFNKNGGPIWIYPFANVNLKALMRCHTAKDVLLLMAQRCEYAVELMKQQSKKLGRRVETQTVIFDFGDFSMMQALSGDALSLLSGFLRMYEANYPERLEQAVVINVPSLFSVFFNMIKPLLNGTTLSKVSVFGKEGWKEHLLKTIDPDQLPQHWGGNCVDEKTGDPRCNSHITVWTPIAEEEYRRGSIIVNSNGDKMGVGTTVSVDRRSCHEVPVHVKEPGSRLCWQFETEEHDIGFSVSLTTGDETQEELVVRAWERADSHMRPRDGSLLCVDPGTYVLKFDNTFSSYRSKKLTYTFSVLPPTNRIMADA